jgi:hypothetical protein
MFGKKNNPANRRTEQRYKLANMAAYTDEGADSREKLVNVSRGGCCLKTPVKLNKGEHILIHFISSENYYIIENSFCLDSYVAWKNEGPNGLYHYGFQFSQPRSQFFETESSAFRDEVARIACRQYLSGDGQSVDTRNTSAD